MGLLSFFVAFLILSSLIPKHNIQNVVVSEDGWIEAVLPPDPDTFGDAVPDVTDAITKSVILAATIERSES